MAEYTKVKIGSTWLTDDGTEGGEACRVEVEGLGQLPLTRALSIKKATDNTPYAFMAEYAGEGAEITMTVGTMMESEFSAIVSAINTALEAEDEMDIELHSPFGDFEGTAIPQAPEPPTSFAGERMAGVKFKFTIVALS